MDSRPDLYRESEAFYPYPPVGFSYDFLHCPVCNSLSRGGLNGTIEETIGGQFTRYKIAYAAAERRIESCYICHLLCNIVRSYAHKLSDLQNIKISALEGLKKHEITIYDQGSSHVNQLRVKLYYAQPALQWHPFNWAVRNHIQQDPSTEASFGIVKQWINTCHRKHDVCHDRSVPSSLTELPKRLLSLGTQNQRTAKIIEVSDLKVRYTALSYCWGKRVFMKLTSHTINRLKSGVPIRALPKTFQQAITITKQLDVAFIWIDALCIVQDSAQDWNTESSKMGPVYANAYLTLSADAGLDAHHGFLKARVDDSYTFTLRRVESANHESIVVRVREATTKDQDPLRRLHENFLAGGLYELNNSENPTFTRGWCLQERLLAIRVLHFTHCEFIWECATVTSCECQGLEDYNLNLACERGVSKSHLLHKQQFLQCRTLGCSLHDLGNMWYQIVCGYSTRELAFDSDRLPAISAVAQHLQSKELGTYLAGLWQCSLPDALLWRSASTADSGLTRHRRSQDSGCPSWSWASVIGPIDCGFWFAGNDKVLSKVLGACCTPAGPNLYGQVSSGVLDIEAPYVEATLHCSSYEQSSLTTTQYKSFLSIPGHTDSSTDSCYPDIIWEPDGVSYGIMCVLIQVFRKEGVDKYQALLLVDAVNVPGAWQRVGTATVCLRKPETLQRLQQRTFRLV